jgi:hypothetical protein
MIFTTIAHRQASKTEGRHGPLRVSIGGPVGSGRLAKESNTLTKKGAV